ncbi:3'5'-cyclic nucleotide phosphodiesterase domain-containing protein [Besnoitia besnoiti]|uniref:Phosphodiesterase n=1 Tax=Besnoitia besnoiti TaxID=94643 RepID=A0A2A9MG95_BESBE|nr:3'5'-cyclic nucleotide phosphodiesterase domain-containing protein [Besnoitia besnoiti]PFH34627.1 3'5'-cyclic nucleotide phosphodiesterase domain-containing protein [Besnoitia besnoiti]
MKEDLSSVRHEGSMRSVSGDARGEGGESRGGRLSGSAGGAGGGCHMSTGGQGGRGQGAGGGGEATISGHGSERDRGREASGASPHTNLSRSGSTDVILRRFPLKFVDKELEDLFAANINRWMTTRLILMGILTLVVTSMMWPLMAWSFNLQDAFNHHEPLGILFHIDMSVTVIVSVIFVTTKNFRRLARHAELIADAGTFLVVTMWGIWNTIASYILEHSYVQDVISSSTTATHAGYVSLEKTSAWSTSLEASSAVAYLYGLLLIVQLDVVYPSRSRRTWQVHVMFFGFSAASIIIRGALNPDFVPVPFVILRVATYLMLTVFLFIGRHATELQQRQTFYNWLATRKRVDRLESDLKRQKENMKVSTAVEQLVHMVKQCMDSCHTVESEVGSEHRSLLAECNQTLSKCLSILTNTSNLYTVQFGDLDSDAHRDIIQAFLNNHNTSPADWTRVTTAAYTRGVDDLCWTAPGVVSGERHSGGGGNGNSALLDFDDAHSDSHPVGSATRSLTGWAGSSYSPSASWNCYNASWSGGIVEGVFVHPQAPGAHSPGGASDGGKGPVLVPLGGAVGGGAGGLPPRRSSDLLSPSSGSDRSPVLGAHAASPPLPGSAADTALARLEEGRSRGGGREEGHLDRDGRETSPHVGSAGLSRPHARAWETRGDGRTGDRGDADVVRGARKRQTGGTAAGADSTHALEENGLKASAAATAGRGRGGSTGFVHHSKRPASWNEEGETTDRCPRQEGKRDRKVDSGLTNQPLTPQSLADLQARIRYEAIVKILNASPRSTQLSVSGFAVNEAAVRQWSFDCLRHAQTSPSPLVDVGYALLHRACDDLRLPGGDVLLRFLTAVEIQYNPVPYHNCVHGLMVAQKMVALLELLDLTESMDCRDLALVVVAGLCHDIGHPGRNNALFINALDPVAILYNDKSVLENYHSCLTFKTLELPDCDIFLSLRTKEYHVVRSLIIDLILATDMKNHFETVSRFRVRRNALDFDMSADEDFWFVVKMIMKCADLAHCGVAWAQHFQWCQRLSVEFYDQGEEEVVRHLPMSPLCDREKHAEIAKSQLGFMNFVAVPLFEEISAVDSSGNIERECIAVMKTNTSHWESLSVAGTPVPLWGQAVAADVKPPLLHLIDGSGAGSVRPGSKAAEIAARYSAVTYTSLDLTSLVCRTQLSRTRRGSQQSGHRMSDGTST